MKTKGKREEGAVDEAVSLEPVEEAAPAVDEAAPTENVEATAPANVEAVLLPGARLVRDIPPGRWRVRPMHTLLRNGQRFEAGSLVDIPAHEAVELGDAIELVTE